MSEDNQDNVEKDLLGENISVQNISLQSIFTYDEIESMVKGFILNWLRGEIIIDFPNSQSILARVKFEGKEISNEAALKIERQIKQDFRSKIEICSGIKNATSDEVKQSVYYLFTKIMIYRGSRRIDGKFAEFEMEQRISILEKQMDATNRLVKELVTWLTEEDKGYRNGV